jgi:hypothetical protein
MSKEQTELLADYFTEKLETTTTEILEILFMSNTHMIEENKKQPRSTESPVMRGSLYLFTFQY